MAADEHIGTAGSSPRRRAWLRTSPSLQAPGVDGRRLVALAITSTGLALGILTALLALTPAARGQAPPSPAHLEPIGHLGGTVERVAVGAGWAFVATPAGVAAVDVADPTRPGAPIATPLVSLDVSALAAAGPWLYVGHDAGRLSVLDVADPRRVRVVGEYRARAPIEDIAVAGSTLYLAVGAAGLEIVDLALPARPVWRGRLATGLNTHAVEVAAGRAYLAEQDPWEARLRVVDVADPAAPRELGAVHVIGAGDYLALAGSVAVVAGSGGSAWTVDVSDPAHPAVVQGGFAAPRGLAVGRHALYLGTPTDVRIASLSPGGYVTLATYVPVVGGVRQLAWADDRLYVAAGAAGLRIYDVSTPSAPKALGGNQVDIASAAALATDGAYLYLAEGDRTLRVLDVRAGPPAWVGRLELPRGQVRGLAWQPDQARLLAAAHPEQVMVDRRMEIRGAGLARVDTTDPAAPLLASVQEGSKLEAVAARGDLVVAASSQGVHSSGQVDPSRTNALLTFKVLNGGQVSGVRAARPLDTYFEAVDLAFAGDYLYAALAAPLGNGGLRVYRIPDADKPTRLAALSPADLGVRQVRALAVHGSYLLVARDGGLSVLDVARPEAPAPVATVPMPGGADDVAVVGDYAVVLDTGRGVVLLNVADPVAPVELDTYPLPAPRQGTWGPLARQAPALAPAQAPAQAPVTDTLGSRMHVVLHGDRVFAAFGDRGLFLLRIVPGPRATVTPAAPITPATTATATATPSPAPSETPATTSTATPTTSPTPRQPPPPGPLYLPSLRRSVSG